MVTTLKDVMKTIGAPRRKKIAARAGELVAEEMSLRELRHAYRLTQEHVAASLGVGQEGVSRLEKRGDLLISTLCGYVEALGGKLRLVAEFPNSPPVLLTGLAAMEQGTAAGGRAPLKGGIKDIGDETDADRVVPRRKKKRLRKAPSKPRELVKIPE